MTYNQAKTCVYAQLIQRHSTDTCGFLAFSDLLSLLLIEIYVRSSHSQSDCMNVFKGIWQNDVCKITWFVAVSAPFSVLQWTILIRRSLLLLHWCCSCSAEVEAEKQQRQLQGRVWQHQLFSDSPAVSQSVGRSPACWGKDSKMSQR